MPGIIDVPGNHVTRSFIFGQATAGTDDEWPVFVCPANLTVVGVKWIPKANVTADPTNNYALQVINRGAANAGTGAVTTVRTYDGTSAGNESKNVAESFTIGAAPDCSTGDVLSLVRTHNGTGLAMPQGQLEITYKFR